MSGGEGDQLQFHRCLAAGCDRLTKHAAKLDTIGQYDAMGKVILSKIH